MTTMRLVIPLLAPAVKRTLVADERFDRRSIQEVLDSALADYERQLPQLPRETSKGGALMVRVAALTIGFYRALLARDVSASEARTLTASVTAQIYQKIAAVPTALSKMGASDKRDRLVRATSLFRKFPFSLPSYIMLNVQDDSGAVAFDVQRCPVAQYFRAQDLSELCVESWCDLDFALARRWDARLERTQTISAGADHCDFRWHPSGTDPEPPVGGGDR